MPRTETVTGGRAATTGVIPGRWALSVGNPGTKPPFGFRWVRLTDIARLESGHTPSRRVSSYWGGSIPWVGIRDATGNHGRTIYSTNEGVTEAGIANSSARVLPAGTVCLSRTASVGYVVTMGVPMATSQDFVNWVCGPGIRFKYLHYIFISEQDSVRRFAHGTTHQTVYYPEAKAFHVCIPNVDEQDAIVRVLGVLDDKIAGNERIAGTAIRLADAQFEEALTPEPVRACVGEVATFHNQHRVPLSSRQRSEFSGPYPYYGANGVVDSVADFRFDGDYVLVGEDGTVVSEDSSPVIHYAHGRFWVNNHAHVLTGLKVSNEVLLSALKVADVRPYVTGAVQPKLSMGNLKRLRIALPNESVRPALERELRHLYSFAEARKAESRSLAELRDTLLPGLMSGAIRVRDAEKAVEDA